MITKVTTISDLDIYTVRKDIQNIHLSVYSPNGRIRVAAPLSTTDEKIRLVVLSKIAWIKKQQAKFLEQDCEPKREYVSGESHFLMGKRYLLNVTQKNAKPMIMIKRTSQIEMCIRPNSDIEKREKLMNNFYRLELKKQVIPLLEKWKRTTGIEIKELKIRKMKTRWGSCNPKQKRVWLNLELAKKPLHCIEYVLVHELAHIVEKKHDAKFKSLMTSFMPNWKQYKHELNYAKLSYSKWEIVS